MKADFKGFDTSTAVPVAAPLDFASLCVSLARAQAALPTVRIAASDAAAPARPSADLAVVLFRNEDGWDQAPAAMGGSFHSGAAGFVTDN